MLHEKICKILLPSSIYLRFKTSAVAKRIAKNTFWNLLGSALSRILILLAMILIARILGKVSFGELGLVQATLGVAGLMAGLGLGTTATRFVAQLAHTDKIRAGRVIGLVKQTTLITVLLISLTLIATSSLIATYFLNAPHLNAALIIGAFLMAANVMRGVQSGLIAGLERFDLIAKLNIFEGVLALLAMVVFANYMGVEGALIGLIVGSIAAQLVGKEIIKRELDKREIKPIYAGCWREWKILSGYSLPSLLANLVATPVLWLCMTMLANQPDGYAQLGIYNAAYQWHGPMIFIPMAVTSASLPMLVQQWESGDARQFRKVMLGVVGLTLAIAIPPVVLVSVFSPWVMSFYGLGFREGWFILVLILTAAPLHALAKVASAALIGMNRAWTIFNLNICWGLVLYALSAILIPDYGVYGMAISFVVAYFVLGIGSTFVVATGLKKHEAR